MRRFLSAVKDWLETVWAQVLIGFGVAIAAGLASEREISWFWVVVWIVGAELVPPGFGGRWIQTYPSRWSRESALGALATAVLIFALIRVDISWARGLLALATAFVSYLAGAYSKPPPSPPSRPAPESSG